jgi:hypothetical protein
MVQWLKTTRMTLDLMIKNLFIHLKNHAFTQKTVIGHTDYKLLKKNDLLLIFINLAPCPMVGN